MNLLKANLFEQFVLITHAISDGLATTALLSACYWYTITPIAPVPLMMLCKDPVSWKIVMSLTILATMIAIPVAYIRYQQLQSNMLTLCRTLFKENLRYCKKYQKAYVPCLPLPKTRSKNRKDVLVTSVMSALTIAGVILSTTWTYASLIIGANISTTADFHYWDVFALTSLFFSVLLGCAIGIIKNKNIQREFLISFLQQSNRQSSQSIKISSSMRANHFTLDKILYR